MAEKIPISVTHPELAKQAVGWDPSGFTAGSAQKKRWKCQKGHEWDAAIGSRALRNFGCPICSNQQVLIGYNDFATTHPELLKELVNPPGTEFVAGSTSITCEWLCSNGHRYFTKPQNRTVRQQGCPVCAGREVLAGFNDLATTHPDIAKDAHNFDPTTLSAGSHKTVEWRCERGHVYKSMLKQRIGNKSNCSVCYGRQIIQGVNDLSTTDPELSQQAFGWDTRTITRGSDKKLQWKCTLGHVWMASPNSRTNMNSGCPFCTGRALLIGFNDLLTKRPELAAQADGWDPKNVLAGTHQKKKWKCPEGHKWTAVVKDRASRGDGCPSCSTFGFDLSKPAWLYFLKHEKWGLLQIGITNFPDNRILDHTRKGWELIEVRGPMDGLLTRQWEIEILKALKLEGAKFEEGLNYGHFSGYTESWVATSTQVESIRELMDLVEKRDLD